MAKFSSLLVVLLLMLASFAANAQGYPRGDVNQDGTVNISDVTCLIDNLLAGVPEGDVNQDGVANISDVTSLIDYLLSGSWPDEPATPPDNHEWVDLGLPSGTLWATCNVGASSPEEYGDHFAWGETAPKDYYGWSTYKWCINRYYDGYEWRHNLTKYCTNSYQGYKSFYDNKRVLDPEDDAAYVNWGASWRMPTTEQQQELVENCTWTETTLNGVKGRLVTGPNGNTIFMPLAGRYVEDLVLGYSYLQYAGSFGDYWSRTLASSPTYRARKLSIESGVSWKFTSERYVGMTVRAVRIP